MRSVPTLAAVLALALAAPAMAQSSSTPNSGGSSAAGTPNSTGSTASTPAQPGAMADAVKKDLSQAGFTDIQVMPSSFLVRAKDRSGRPVMMVINPDSVTEITNVATPGTDTAKK